MRIVLVSDAWLPQVNGVVRTLSMLTQELGRAGHEVTLVTPDSFFTVPCPTQREIRLAVAPGRRVARLIAAANPEAIHIATEGPLGLAARSYCRRRRLTFTTSFHTRFAEYLAARFGLPAGWTWALLRRFHAPAAAIMVATATIRQELEARGFQRLAHWGRGVDTTLFGGKRPDGGTQADPFAGLARPIFLNVGRVAVEKNLPAFLDLELPGSKVVVGDGPALAALQRRYPDCRFLGARFGADLALIYAAADAFVFPSRTDTFGLVLLEALASGLPVAAFRAPGPLDLAAQPGAERVAVIDDDLGRAARVAVTLDRDACRSFARDYGWSASAAQFVGNLKPIDLTPPRHEAHRAARPGPAAPPSPAPSR